MLTPQEVSEHVFAKASFGGYNMAMVDEFLDVVTGDYTALYNENAVLKSKMKVLVDKVEEYRSTEEAMRKALMTAQRMADELVREAEQKRDEIIRQAEQEGADVAQRIRKDLADEEYRLTVAQNATAACVLKAKKLYEEQIRFLDTLDGVFPAPAQAQEHNVAETVQDIENNVQRLLEQQDENESEQPAEAPGEENAEEAPPREPTVEFPAVEPAPVQGDAPVRSDPAAPEGEPEDLEDTAAHHIDFGDLRFGKDYEIK